MSKCIKEIVSMPKIKLNEKGKNGQDFVLKEKNNVLQTNKILNWYIKKVK